MDEMKQKENACAIALDGNCYADVMEKLLDVQDALVEAAFSGASQQAFLKIGGLVGEAMKILNKHAIIQ